MEIKTPPFFLYPCSSVRESVILTKTCFLGTLLGAQSAIAVTAEFVCLENTESACKSFILLENNTGTEEPFETMLLFTKARVFLPVLSYLSYKDFFSSFWEQPLSASSYLAS